MSKRTNIINNILYIILTVIALVFVTQVCNARYSDEGFAKIILWLILGAIIDGFFCVLAHELGHVIVGKKNGFKFVSISVLFFKWHRKGKKIVFDFTLPVDAMGATEMTPVGIENLDKRLKKMTAGALWFSGIITLVGILPLCITKLPFIIFALLSMFLPMGFATFFGNALPMSNEGARNDGAVVYGLKKNDDVSKVSLSLLSIQAELLSEKSPCEIDKKFYFDVPQLAENDLNFLMLLKARYEYFLDKEYYENAKKVTDRMLSLEEYFSKNIMSIVKADALYNACTFNYDEHLADELMYETEKYLNHENSLSNLRIKLAYLVYVKKNYSVVDVFYKKGMRDIKNSLLKGYAKFERKLLDKIKADADKLKENIE